MSFEFELVTVRAEISHAHTIAHCAGRIGHHQMRIRSESRAESLRGESEKKQKTAHPTTDNANVTNVERRFQISGACVSFWEVQAASLFFHQRMQFLLDKADEVFVVSTPP